MARRLSRARFVIIGAPLIVANFKALSGFRIGPGKHLAKGVKEAAKFLLKESNKLVPEEYGDLRRSGKVVGDLRRRHPEVAVTYGDENVDYAIYVHEGLKPAPGATKKARWPGRMGKFLETAFRRYRKEMLDIVGLNVKIK